jgi:hypothetical protein
MTQRLLTAAGILLCAGLLTLPAFAATTLEREFRPDRAHLSLVERGGRTHVEFAGAAREVRPGMPDLPWIGERIDLPDGFRVAKVEVLELDTEPLAGSVRLPSTNVMRPGLTPDDERTPEDPAAFSAAGAEPRVPVVLGAQGTQGGRPVAMLGLAPARWDASTGRLERVSRVRVRLTLEAATFDDVVRPLRTAPGTGLTSVQRNAALLGAVASDARGARPFAATQVPSLNGSPVAYVIITSDDMAAQYQRLADWKTRSGVPAVVRTMSFIRQQYPRGADDAERVRDFIRDAYTRWGTLWVLLGGDTEVIPTRLAYTTFYGGENIACDLYFSCLDGNWNADGDSTYGEGYQSVDDTGDAVDLMPEVYVGRAPTTTVAQAQVFVDKSLQYQTDPDASAYQPKTLFFAEVLFPQNWSPGMGTTLDGAELCEEVLPYLDLRPSLDVKRMYENYTDARWRPGATRLTRLALIDSLNSGYNMAIHVGHGYRNVMSVGDDNLTNGDAASLTNGRRLTNLYAINCTSNAIDFPSIGEAFLHNPNGGAVTNVGSTRFDFPTAGRLFQKEYFRLFCQDSMNAVGELQAAQKLPFIIYSTYDGVYRWTEMTLLLLGDPELRIYSRAPRTLVVTHAGSMPVGDSLYSVHVEVGGLPLGQAQVTAYKAGADYATATTDGAGNVTLPFRPDSLGSIQLTVTAFDAKPYQGSVTVVGSALPALTDLTPTIDDDNAGGTAGNGNGRLDAGEVVDLRVPVRNNGGSAAGSVAGTLTTPDALVGLANVTQSYGTVAAGAAVTPAGAFRLTLPSTLADQREVPFQLQLEDGVGHRWVGEFQLTVLAPEFRLLGNTVVDAGGNADGVVDPGEAITYTPRVRNAGTGAAENVTAVLRSLDGFATVTDSTAAWGTLAAGAEASGDAFAYSVSSTAAVLQLRVSDAHGLRLVRTLDVVRPATPVDPIANGLTVDIQLTWTRVLDADLMGYNLYRSISSSGPFARITTVPTDRSAYYADHDLASLTRYYYVVTAVDSSGNESLASAVTSALTVPPNHAIFPIPMNRNTPSSVTIDHVYTGYPVAIAAGADNLYVFHPDGTAPVDADGQGTTVGDFSLRGKYFAGGVSIADLDGDGLAEFIGTTWDSSRVYAFARDGSIMPGFPVLTGSSFSGVAVGDLDGDGKKEMAFGANGTSFYVLRYNGTDFLDGDSNPATVGVFRVITSTSNYGTPALADLDGNGTKEIVYGDASGRLHAWRVDGSEMPGFPILLGGTISSAPAIGYLDGSGDTQLDIVVPAADDSVYAFTAAGATRAGWPKRVMNHGVSKLPSTALADLDKDGFLDIVQAGTDGLIYVFDRFGVPIAPWTSGIPYSALATPGINAFASESSPVVADINGDGWEDVVMGGEDVTVTAISGIDGTVLPGFPIVLGAEVRGTPAVCDCDGDTKSEVVVAGWDANLYVWDYDFPFSPGRTPSWPQFHHDAARSGLFSNPVFVSVDDDGGPVAAVPGELAFAAPQPNPARGGTRLSYAIPSTRPGERFELAVFDLSGRRVRTLAQGEAHSGRWSAAWDLRGEDGARVGEGVYFVRLALGATARSQKLIVLQ